MKKLFVVLAAVSLIVCAVLGAGCTGTSDPFVGKWVTHDGAISLICNDDGTGTIKFNKIPTYDVPPVEKIVWKKLDVSDFSDIQTDTPLGMIYNLDKDEIYEVYSKFYCEYIDMMIGVRDTEYGTLRYGAWLTPLFDGKTLAFVTYDEFADFYGVYPN